MCKAPCKSIYRGGGANDPVTGEPVNLVKQRNGKNITKRLRKIFLWEGGSVWAGEDLCKEAEAED